LKTPRMAKPKKGKVIPKSMLTPARRKKKWSTLLMEWNQKSTRYERRAITAPTHTADQNVIKSVQNRARDARGGEPVRMQKEGYDERFYYPETESHYPVTGRNEQTGTELPRVQVSVHHSWHRREAEHMWTGTKRRNI
jgi:hypothetical protein